MEAGSATGERSRFDWRIWAVVPVLLLALAVGVVVSSGSSLVDLVGTPPNFTAHAGGSPYNVAITLARLGRPVALVARTGRDAFGDLLTTKARDSGVSFDRWHFEGPNGPETYRIGETPFQVNVGDAMTEALRQGLGIGVLPLYSAVDGLRDGSLVRVLPAYRLQRLNAYALYASRQYLDAKIRTWVAYLREQIPGALEADEAFVRAVSEVVGQAH